MEAGKQGRVKNLQISNSRKVSTTPGVGWIEAGGGVSGTQEGLESPGRSWTHSGTDWWEVETQEMQMLLELFPETERGRKTLASPFFPPTRLLSLLPIRGSIKEVSPFGSLQRGWPPSDTELNRGRARNGFEGKQGQAQHWGTGVIFNLFKSQIHHLENWDDMYDYLLTTLLSA